MIYIYEMIHQSWYSNFLIIKIKIISSYDFNKRWKSENYKLYQEEQKREEGKEIILYFIVLIYLILEQFDCLLNSLLLLIRFNKSPRLITPIIRFYPRVKRCRNLPIHRTRRIRLTRPENAFRIRVLAERSIVVLRHQCWRVGTTRELLFMASPEIKLRITIEIFRDPSSFESSFIKFRSRVPIALFEKLYSQLIFLY